VPDPTFDPRFDPAFQRGYEPEVHAPKAPRTRPKVEPIGDPPAATEPQAPELAAEEVTPQEQAPLRRGVNPYIVVLWAVGVVFAVAGVVLFVLVIFQSFSSDSSGTQPDLAVQSFRSFGYLFAAPLLTVGLATIAGVIVFSAARVSRRSRAQL
jgi:hypothetical protein